MAVLLLMRTAYKVDLVVLLAALFAVMLFFWIFPPGIWFQPGKERCPHCLSRDIRPSSVSGLVDRVRIALQAKPFRCRNCRARFLNRTHMVRF